jgi:hypothetical protein
MKLRNQKFTGVDMKKLIPLFLMFAFLNISCSVYQTLANLARLKFKLGNVNGLNVNGVQLSNKSRLADFSAQEILTISAAVAKGNLPVSFILNVDAKNPNDGTGGYAKTNATIKSFPWRLLVDDKETVTGNIAAPFTVPGTGETVNIPLQIGFDVMNFFKDRNYESILNLLLAIGGRQGSSSILTIFSSPTVTTSAGNIKYPGEIKIVSMDYSN